MPTVQGALQKVLNKVSPDEDVFVYQSSRTDAGVHALCNSAHFDLQHRQGPERGYQTDILQKRLNTLLRNQDEDIRILKIQRVNDDFHARYQAIERSYVYRVAVQPDSMSGDRPVSILDNDLVLKIRPPFNTDLFLRSVEVFAGTHNFSAFTSRRNLRENPSRNPVKTLSVGISQGASFCGTLGQPDHASYWNIHFSSESFLFHQIRRMVGSMMSVGCGKLNISDLQRIVDDSRNLQTSKSHLLVSAPPWGLFLVNVKYKPEDLVYTPDPLEGEDGDVMRSSQHLASESVVCDRTQNLETSYSDSVGRENSLISESAVSDFTQVCDHSDTSDSDSVEEQTIDNHQEKTNS